jgi:hypothetical protein
MRVLPCSEARSGPMGKEVICGSNGMACQIAVNCVEDIFPIADDRLRKTAEDRNLFVDATREGIQEPPK